MASPWKENRRLRATVQEQAERLVQKDAEIAALQAEPVSELKKTLIRTHNDREAAWARVAELEGQLAATQKQLDDALGYTPTEQRQIAVHSHVFGTGQ